MLVDEYSPDTDSNKSDTDSKDKTCSDLNYSETHNDKEEIDSDDDIIKNDSESSNEIQSTNKKIVLPFELEELVKEALAELKPMY